MNFLAWCQHWFWISIVENIGSQKYFWLLIDESRKTLINLVTFEIENQSPYTVVLYEYVTNNTSIILILHESARGRRRRRAEVKRAWRSKLRWRCVTACACRNSGASCNVHLSSASSAPSTPSALNLAHINARRFEMQCSSYQCHLPSNRMCVIL